MRKRIAEGSAIQRTIKLKEIMIPTKQIRALFTDKTIRVYQAYCDEIADPALQSQTFVSPFGRSRMTWIKPSFLWMMYRAGCGFKDPNQRRILSIDITHEGFAWALNHSCGSKPPSHLNKQEWKNLKENTPVRIQWDPERDSKHNALDYRSIQIGLSGEAVERYVDDWIQGISEVTDLAHEIFDLVGKDKLAEAAKLCPSERVYDLYSDVDQLGG